MQNANLQCNGGGGYRGSLRGAEAVPCLLSQQISDNLQTLLLQLKSNKHKQTMHTLAWHGGGRGVGNLGSKQQGVD